MKNILTILLLIFIYSCDNQTEQINKNNNIETTPTDTLPTTKEIDDEIEIDKEDDIAITIEDIPKTWYKLNLQESKQYTINEWCEIQSIQLEIEKNENGGWQILASYPTDSKRFKIIGFDASETSNENESIISGNFIIENPDYPDMDPDIYSFYWNKGMMYATFDGFFENETRMVSELNKQHYELVKENCDYLDEDQER